MHLFACENSTSWFWVNWPSTLKAQEPSAEAHYTGYGSSLCINRWCQRAWSTKVCVCAPSANNSLCVISQECISCLISSYLHKSARHVSSVASFKHADSYQSHIWRVLSLVTCPFFCYQPTDGTHLHSGQQARRASLHHSFRSRAANLAATPGMYSPACKLQEPWQTLRVEKNSNTGSQYLTFSFTCRFHSLPCQLYTHSDVRKTQLVLTFVFVCQRFMKPFPFIKPGRLTTIYNSAICWWWYSTVRTR